jgi:hypothetical protein
VDLIVWLVGCLFLVDVLMLLSFLLVVCSYGVDFSAFELSF